MSTMPTLEIIDRRVISKPGDRFLAWPTLARLRNGELLAVASGNRDRHVCPYGRVQLFRSSDEGCTWQGPHTLTNGPLDDRDGGIVEAADGTLVAVWFSSLTFEKILHEDRLPQDFSSRERAAWTSVSNSLNDETRFSEIGCWATTSRDGGETWSEKVPTVAGSPHGPILLSDGRLFYAGKFAAQQSAGLKGGPYIGRIGASESLDNGKSWKELSEISPMPGHDAIEYHELHACEAADGRIVVHIRNHLEPFSQEILQTESFDGGRTWTPVHTTGLWGFPAHLLRLRDGRLLSSYTHRRDPRGNRVAISEDHGATWSEPLLLTTDGGKDFGYPSTVELDNGDLLTLWYDRPEEQPHAALHLARWRLHHSPLAVVSQPVGG